MRRARFGVVAAVALVATLAQQGAPPRKLGAPTATYDEEFTGIDGVRELKDGRVVVLDAKDKAIHVIDLKAKTGKKIGREGDGPGEFRLVQELFSAPGDTLAVSDIGRFGKLLVITPAGEVDGLMSMIDSSLSTRNFNPMASDAAGRLYTLYTANPFTDSTAIVRWDRTSGRRDTVAKLMMTPVSPLYRGPPEVRTMPGGAYAYRPGPPMPFSTSNQWAISGDGRVAIVEAEPYRVALINANGVRVQGPPVKFTPVQVTDAEKAEYKAQATQPVAVVGFARGERTTGFQKPPYTEPPEWPPTLQAFGRKAPTFAPDGLLWVKRNTKAGAPPLYDVFDRAGKLAFQLELPPKTKVVGFGRGSVYLARVDDDDLHFLQRYKLP